MKIEKTISRRQAILRLRSTTAAKIEVSTSGDVYASFSGLRMALWTRGDNRRVNRAHLWPIVGCTNPVATAGKVARALSLVLEIPVRVSLGCRVLGVAVAGRIGPDAIRSLATPIPLP